MVPRLEMETMTIGWRSGWQTRKRPEEAPHKKHHTSEVTFYIYSQALYINAQTSRLRTLNTNWLLAWKRLRYISESQGEKFRKVNHWTATPSGSISHLSYSSCVKTTSLLSGSPSNTHICAKSYERHVAIHIVQNVKCWGPQPWPRQPHFNVLLG